jgi:hypothetical protein
MALGPWRRGKNGRPLPEGLGARRMVPGRGKPATSRPMGYVHPAHDARMTSLPRALDFGLSGRQARASEVFVARLQSISIIVPSQLAQVWIIDTSQQEHQSNALCNNL